MHNGLLNEFDSIGIFDKSGLNSVFDCCKLGLESEVDIVDCDAQSLKLCLHVAVHCFDGILDEIECLLLGCKSIGNGLFNSCKLRFKRNLGLFDNFPDVIKTVLHVAVKCLDCILYEFDCLGVSDETGFDAGVNESELGFKSNGLCLDCRLDLVKFLFKGTVHRFNGFLNKVDCICS